MTILSRPKQSFLHLPPAALGGLQRAPWRLLEYCNRAHYRLLTLHRMTVTLAFLDSQTCQEAFSHAS